MDGATRIGGGSRGGIVEQNRKKEACLGKEERESGILANLCLMCQTKNERWADLTQTEK